MVKILAWFWLRRFILGFVVVFICLTAVELVQQGISANGLIAVAGWSLTAGLVAATIATYWGYRIQCKVVYGDSVKNNNQKRG